MPGTIRIFIGLFCLILAGSVDDTLPISTMLMISIPLALFGLVIGLSGARAANEHDFL